MSKPFKALAIASGVLVITAATVGASGGGGFTAGTRLTGYQEVPAVSTTGNGSFRAVVSRDGLSISFRLSYAGMESTVTQSHLHFGQKGVNGGISIFFCSNLGNGPAGTQACPASPATVTGTVTAADVIGPSGQGISPGEWAEVIAAIRARVTYVNVHTVNFPGGEIRGQVRVTDD